MKKIGFVLLLLVLASCAGNRKQNVVIPESSSGQEDTLVLQPDSVVLEEEQDNSRPTEADGLFEDFVFNYASNKNIQRQRTVFPLPLYKDDRVEKIDEKHWKYDPIFVKLGYYTLFFDSENDMDLASDTTMKSVQIEWINLQNNREKKYYFEKLNGMWMLEAVNLCEVKKDDMEFYEFYRNFVSDSIYQSHHVPASIQYVTLDPDDEFSILETTLNYTQWRAFNPTLPDKILININYGQKLAPDSRNRILKVCGVANGFSNVFYFNKRDNEWRMYKYEDTSI